MRMLLRRRSEPGTKRIRQFLDMSCDRCKKEYSIKFSSFAIRAKNHYCCRKCSQAEHQHLRLAAAASPLSIEKKKATTKKCFGVECVFSLPEIHALVNTTEKCQQRHETMKRNGSYKTSKTEDEFYVWLCQKFGNDNIDRQKVINGWPIDFYIKNFDLYIQFDGEYWHGLDRTLSEISQFKTSRDQTILQKYELDRQQEKWFSQQDLRLIRITDKQFFKKDDLPYEFR